MQRHVMTASQECFVVWSVFIEGWVPKVVRIILHTLNAVSYLLYGL
jgi:hypothetical protein